MPFILYRLSDTISRPSLLLLRTLPFDFSPNGGLGYPCYEISAHVQARCDTSSGQSETAFNKDRCPWLYNAHKLYGKFTGIVMTTHLGSLCCSSCPSASNRSRNERTVARCQCQLVAKSVMVTTHWFGPKEMPLSLMNGEMKLLAAFSKMSQ